MPVGGKSESVVTSHYPGRFGTVPVGGERIVLISIERRNCGFRMVIETDEVTVTIDIP